MVDKTPPQSSSPSTGTANPSNLPAKADKGKSGDGSNFNDTAATVLNEVAKIVEIANFITRAFETIDTKVEKSIKQIEGEHQAAIKGIQLEKAKAISAIQQALQSALAAIASAKPTQSQSADNSNLNRPPGWNPKNPGIHPD